MAAAQGIRAGRAFVELFADDTKLVRGLRAAEKRLKAFGASVQSIGTKIFGLGAAAIAPLLATTNVFAELGDQLAKMSARTGISVESLSELGYAAEQSGADMETLEGGVRKLQKFLVSVAEGSDSALSVLSSLGLTLADLARLTPDRQFELLADRISQIQDPAIRAAMAMEVFGKTGTSLLPMFQDGAKGIQALRKQARDLGLVIRTEDAKAAEQFGDTLSDLWKVIKSGVFAVGMAIVPLLQDWAISAIQVAKVTADWVRDNKQLIVTVFKIVAGVMAAGAAILALGVLVYGVGAAFGIAASLFTGVGVVLGTIGTVIAALLSPIGLVSVAIIGLGGYLLYASGLGAEALQWLGDQFQALKADALAAWQGIRDALAAGDLSLAAKILWLTLKMEWQKGVAFLEEHWAAFKEFFLSVATDAFYGVVGVLINAWSGLQSAWIETTAFLADVWTVFTSSLTKGWSTAQNFISKGVLRLPDWYKLSVAIKALEAEGWEARGEGTADSVTQALYVTNDFTPSDLAGFRQRVADIRKRDSSELAEKLCREMETIIGQYQTFESGEWVDFKFTPGMPGWQGLVAEEWKQVDEQTVTIQSDFKAILSPVMRFRAPYAVEVDVQPFDPAGQTFNSLAFLTVGLEWASIEGAKVRPSGIAISPNLLETLAYTDMSTQVTKLPPAASRKLRIRVGVDDVECTVDGTVLGQAAAPGKVLSRIGFGSPPWSDAPTTCRFHQFRVQKLANVQK